MKYDMKNLFVFIQLHHKKLSERSPVSFWGYPWRNLCYRRCSITHLDLIIPTIGIISNYDTLWSGHPNDFNWYIEILWSTWSNVLGKSVNTASIWLLCLNTISLFKHQQVSKSRFSPNYPITEEGNFEHINLGKFLFVVCSMMNIGRK